jgi:hypothetical protein
MDEMDGILVEIMCSIFTGMFTLFPTSVGNVKNI